MSRMTEFETKQLGYLRSIDEKLGKLLASVPLQETVKGVLDTTVSEQSDGLLSIPEGKDAPWVAMGKEYLGLDEYDDRDTIMTKILQPVGIEIDPSETPWCAAFVRGILFACGLPTPNTLRARDFESYGQECAERPGAIVVYRSHVGFVTEPGKILGGNQSDGINIGEQTWYGKPITYRFPEGYQV